MFRCSRSFNELETAPPVGGRSFTTMTSWISLSRDVRFLVHDCSTRFHYSFGNCKEFFFTSAGSLAPLALFRDDSNWQLIGNFDV